MGYEVVEFCKDTGVTPVYYDHLRTGTRVMENFRNDYNQHGIEQG